MAGKDLSAKLAVILHADVVGSTELVRRDEKRAHARIQETFHQLGETIGTYLGRVRELRGDALLAEFERASDAVSAALAFQVRQQEYVDGLDDDIRPMVRIGIALGEVVIADDTITGAGVVLAQRFEQLAPPGGVCITPAIREALPSRLPFDLENLGAHLPKGFDHETDVYRVSLRDAAELPGPETEKPARAGRPRKPSPTSLLAGVLVILAVVTGLAYLAWNPASESSPSERAEESVSERPSIAVLPFDNLSGDPNQEYFADGITEDLTTDLSRISGLFVVSRNSAFSYKGQSIDVRVVAEELGVRYVLEGSVRRAGEQVRINAQLIDGSDGGHVWAERFDGSMAGVFKLQDDVNRRIVSALEVTLTPDDKKRFDRIETTVPEAYDVLLRGVEEYNTYTSDAIARSRALFERAAELDPSYARALANIALTHATDVNFYWSSDRETSIRLGLEYAEKALALDSNIPQIYLTRSILYLSQRQYPAAIEAGRRTVEVHPQYADGQATLAFILSYDGQFEEALEALARAHRINPQGTGIYFAVEGRILFQLGRYDEALERLEVAISRNPAFDRMHLNLAAVYAAMGRLDDARWSVDEALAISPDINLASERQNSLYRRQSDLDKFLEALRLAGIPQGPPE
jgi:adenylate cyclase